MPAAKPISADAYQATTPRKTHSAGRLHPEHIRLFDTYEALNTEAGLRELLTFVGIAPEQQVLAVGTRVEGSPERSRRPRQLPGSPMDPRRCVILVPFATSIIPPCERALSADQNCVQTSPGSRSFT